METQETQTQNVSNNGHGSAFGAIGLFIFDFLKVFLIAVAIIVPIRLFLFQPFVVTGDSMLPNFVDGDYLIIDEISYRLREPARGEVIVMHAPKDPSQFFIKRLIGLPGERVMIDNRQVVIYNQQYPRGLILQEDYLPKNSATIGDIDFQLGSGEFFVMGDNRLSSSDSRMWGPLNRESIVGRVYLRILPPKSFQIFNSPSYNPATP